MRTLERNKQKLYCANPTGEEVLVKDEYGFETGEKEDVYTEPVRLKLNISAAAGMASAEAFGAFTDYSRTIATDTKCPIIVGSRIWFGVPPTGPHNYTCVRVARSLNVTMYALKEVVLP